MQQPLGVFYVASIPVRVLLDTAYSDRLQATRNPGDNSYWLEGSQRELHLPRLRQIGAYINTAESTFPNTVILAANYRQKDGTLESDENLRWRIETNANTGIADLVIPTDHKLAPIIDGQHRLFGFNFADALRLDMDLVCSVFVDLPKPFQAFIFATINSTQKPVNKSLTYELFGYDIETEPPEAWSPDKLGVFLARKLNVEQDSPLSGRVLVAAENDFTLSRSDARVAGQWMVSMATVVEGIARLFSQNPKRDSTHLLSAVGRNRKRSALIDVTPTDKSPMRSLYIDGNDLVIYTTVRNFLEAASQSLWKPAREGSFILKTVGMQALFDVLRHLVPAALADTNVSVEFFRGRLEQASHIDFAADFFKNASGSGRIAIRNCIEVCLGLARVDDLPPVERDRYRTICNNAQID